MIVLYSGSQQQPATPAQRTQFLRLLRDVGRRTRGGASKGDRGRSGRHHLQQDRGSRFIGDLQQPRLRQLFRQWQQELEQQRRCQQQLQMRVQRQILSLHEALEQQKRGQTLQQLLVQHQLRELFAVQQQRARSEQHQIVDLQQQVFHLGKIQRNERRNRQVLERQVSRKRPVQPAVETTICCHVGCCPYSDCCPYGDCCPHDDICPCPFFQDSDSTPRSLQNKKSVSVDARANDCLLRNIRLGFVNPPSHSNRNTNLSFSQKKGYVTNNSKEIDGYLADDEASLLSETPSGNSSSLWEERRKLLSEIRDLKNTCITPRYSQIWIPLNCFRCGGPGHLATCCSSQISSL